jgi:hypothetical protein
MLRCLCAALLLALGSPALAQRLAADVECQHSKQRLTYDCHVFLKDARSGKPLDGAEITVTADMPSMPMAHEVKPVKASPGNSPGEYLTRINLEMYGEWTLKLDVRKPVRDVIVKKLRFAEPPR